MAAASVSMVKEGVLTLARTFPVGISNTTMAPLGMYSSAAFWAML